jgi:hypothetical protein
MTRYRVAKRILCFVVAAVLLCVPWGLPGLWAAGAAAPVPAPLGQSTVSSEAAFAKVLGDDKIGTILIGGNINGAALDWAAVQKGDKTISGITGAEKLTLPVTLSAGGALTFDKLTLAKSDPAGTVIYANSHAFRFGAGITMAETFITAIFGGGNTAVGTSSAITLESGMVGAVYLGGYNKAMTGGALVTVAGTATVNGIYGAYEGGVIPGVKTAILRNFGAATGYADTIPLVSGADVLRLENTYLRRQNWNGLGAGRLEVAVNSSLWLDGSMAVASRLHGEGGGLVVSGGKDVRLAETVPPLSGSFALSLRGEGFAWLRGGGAYRSCLTAPQSLYVGGNPDLLIQQITVGSIELIALPQTAYFQGDALQVTGGVVRIHQLPAAVGSRDIPLTAAMVTGFDSSRLGSHTLTVTHEGKTATYTAWVADPAITKLSLDRTPSRVNYTVGEELYLSGGRVEARYRNGSRRMVSFTDSAVLVEGYDPYERGRQELSVYHNGQLAGKYRVTVQEEESASSQAPNPGEVKTVTLLGLPQNSTVEVGESITLFAWPYRDGESWTWDHAYFNLVNEKDGTATFTALREGKSRIAYADEYAETSETLTIIDNTVAMIPEAIAPEQSQSDAGIDTPDSMPPVSILPGASSSSSSSSTPQSDAYVSIKQEESASEESSEGFEEESSEQSAPVLSPGAIVEPVAAPPTQTVQQIAEESPSSLPSRLPLAVIGIGAAVIILIVGGVCVWRFGVK